MPSVCCAAVYDPFFALSVIPRRISVQNQASEPRVDWTHRIHSERLRTSLQPWERNCTFLRVKWPTGGSGFKLSYDEVFLRGFLEQRYHFHSTLQPIQIIRPSLHHFAPLRQMLREVVSGTRPCTILHALQTPVVRVEARIFVAKNP